ncbi:hypothetical protein PENSTE_c012G02360 [Penicillium steckii]|uniref:NAD(P)-binding protein n=1 Tax=Penicillium steckii TaxID=303698 RepID=A0A1V6T680_9EURO|nr:hypothetical protein PENSTE_c012G02360 [Penicillium steckii]
MSNLSKVLLLFGAGPGVGHGITEVFTSQGYKVALASRKPSAELEIDGVDRVHIPCDLSDPSSVTAVFARTKELLGIPSVVVYNAYAANPINYQDPFSVSLEEFNSHLNVNTTSVYAAAFQARDGFAQLPASASRTFIYTGNMLNKGPRVPLLTLGVGKTAAAHLIEHLAMALPFTGFKFYYADQRKYDGSPMYRGLDGEAHGKFYLQLAEGEASQGLWYQTFVKGIGYKKFD